MGSEREFSVGKLHKWAESQGTPVPGQEGSSQAWVAPWSGSAAKQSEDESWRAFSRVCCEGAKERSPSSHSSGTWS